MKVPHFHATRSRQHGMSLVELLVAMTIGLFLMGAMGAVYVFTANSSRGSTLESQMNEDANLALEMLRQQIWLAGYSSFNATGERHFQGMAIRGCDGGFNNNVAATAFDDMTCATTTTGPDAIAIRYEATVLNTQASSTNKPTNCSFHEVEAWNTGSSTVALEDNRYYIAEDAGNANAPTLYCKGRSGADFSDATALVPNIEDLQISYAVTTVPVNGAAMPHQVTSYVDANSSTLGTALDNWSRVAGVSICLLARTARPVPGGGGTAAELGSYVDCKGVRQAGKTDGFLRRAYSTTVQLRNMRPAVASDYGSNADKSVRNPWAYLTEGG